MDMWFRTIIRMLIFFYIKEVNIVFKPLNMGERMLNYEQRKFVKNSKIFLKYFINKPRNGQCVIDYRSVNQVSVLRRLINANLKNLIKYRSDGDYDMCISLFQVIIIASKLAGRSMRFNVNHRKFNYIIQPMIFNETIIAVENFLEKRGIIFPMNDFRLKNLKNIIKIRTRIIVMEIENNLYVL